MKKILSLLVAALMLFSSVSAFAADKEARQPDVFVNDALVEFADQSAYITNEGRTLVPARGVFEALDCEVGWDAENYVVTVAKAEEKKEIVLKIDDTEMKIVTDGKEETKTLEVPAQLMNNRTMIPLRAVSEALGCAIIWNEAEYTINISEMRQISNEEFNEKLQMLFNASQNKEKEEREDVAEDVAENVTKEPEMVYTIADATAGAGDEIAIGLTCETDVDIRILAIALTQYDESVLEFIGFEFDEEIKKLINGKLSSFNLEKKTFVALLEETQAYSGKIGSLKFKIKDDAATGTFEIKAIPSTKTADMSSVVSEVVSGKVVVK